MSPPVDDLAEALSRAFEDGVPIDPLTTAHPDLSVADAYAVQRALVARHEALGRTVVGRKIGLTAKAIQEQLGVDSPDFGVLLDAFVWQTGDTVSARALNAILPRIEAEVAFVLREPLAGDDVDADAVLAATESVAPVFELVDSRISDWKITLADTVADNASCLGAVLGTPMDLDVAGPLDELEVRIGRNGEVLQQGRGSAVLGHPANAVAWLARELHRHGEALPVGQPILSGSFTAVIDATPGRYRADFGERFGAVEVTVTA